MNPDSVMPRSISWASSDLIYTGSHMSIKKVHHISFIYSESEYVFIMSRYLIRMHNYILASSSQLVPVRKVLV